jgi:hypothetical protein
MNNFEEILEQFAIKNHPRKKYNSSLANGHELICITVNKLSKNDLDSYIKYYDEVENKIPDLTLITGMSMLLQYQAMDPSDSIFYCDGEIEYGYNLDKSFFVKNYDKDVVTLDISPVTFGAREEVSNIGGFDLLDSENNFLKETVSFALEEINYKIKYEERRVDKNFCEVFTVWYYEGHGEGVEFVPDGILDIYKLYTLQGVIK